MPPADLPTERLSRFRELLGLSELEGNPLARYAASLGAAPGDFADRIQAFVREMPQLRIIQESLPDPAKLRRNWEEWFSGLFAQGLGEALLTRLWRSGQAHVAHNVDHRLVSTAYALARRHLHERAAAVLPAPELPEALRAIDAMVDCSLLVETDAYVTFATRCELEVVQGIAHQVRNPIAAIGGQARRLLRRHGQEPDVAEAAQVVLDEAARLEALARSVSRYMDVTAREPAPAATPLAALLDIVRSRVAALPGRQDTAFSADIVPSDLALALSPSDLDALLGALLDNAYRYAAPGDPQVRLTCRESPGRPGFATLSIDNTGQTLSAEDLTRIFSPFHSSDPQGTGMGLATAKTIARKYSGAIAMSLLDHGTRCLVSLPLATAGAEAPA
ncbi:MAG: sensor histidine kinase [Solidesulfovibrio sp. DCME]|uniref:sensor histidine kinase n=1 Tax=Solidesulfovibrio sp. DCME TaxID=3447380 RepID=UPI003D1392FB